MIFLGIIVQSPIELNFEVNWGISAKGAAVIKSELVASIAERNPHLYQRDVEHVINAVLEEVVSALSRGDRVELRDFGAFSVKNRRARIGRNPRTGEKVSVEEKFLPFFKPGKEMREKLNGKGS